MNFVKKIEDNSVNAQFYDSKAHGKVIFVDDAIRIAKEYAKEIAKTQREMCITAYETWFNNGIDDDRSAEEALAKTKLATEKGYEIVLLPDIEQILAQTCRWEYDENDCYYKTDCGHSFQFSHDENEFAVFKYCPYCGKLIEESKQIDKLKEEYQQLTHGIMLSINTQFNDEPLWQWFEEKLKAEQEKSESFEQQMNGTLIAYKIDVAATRKQAFDDAIGICEKEFEKNREYGQSITTDIEESSFHGANVKIQTIKSQLQQERDKP